MSPWVSFSAWFYIFLTMLSNMLSLFGIGSNTRSGTEYPPARNLTRKGFFTYVQRRFGVFVVHVYDFFLRNVYPYVLGRHRRRVGRFLASAVGSSQGSRRNPLTLIKTSLVLVLGFGAFLFPQYAQAGIIAGNSASAYVSDYAGMHWIRLGKGISGTLVNSYFHIRDNGSSTYLGNPILYGADIDQQVPITTGVHLKVSVSAETSSACTNYVTVTQTGAATPNEKPRQIIFNWSYYWDALAGGGAGTCVTGSPVLNPNYWYWIGFKSTTSTTSGAVSGTFAMLGTTATLTDNYGTPLQCLSGSTVPGIGVCSNIGTPGYYLADTTLMSGEFGYLAPASDSSQFSLSGAGDFCAGIASSSYAFGIPYGLCYIAGWLFVSSSDAIQTAQANAGLLRTKIPWSYAFQIKDMWGSVSSTSQSVAKFSIPLNIFGASTSSFTILSSASFYRWVDVSTWGVIRSVSSVGLLVGFTLYLWRRSKSLFAE